MTLLQGYNNMRASNTRGQAILNKLQSIWINFRENQKEVKIRNILKIVPARKKKNTSAQYIQTKTRFMTSWSKKHTTSSEGNPSKPLQVDCYDYFVYHKGINNSFIRDDTLRLQDPPNQVSVIDT